MVRVLSIAGSDSGGGAGIQADIKTIERLGGYAMTAVTAITAQDTLHVHAIWPLPAGAVALQTRVVIEDLGVDAIKTGMLGDVQVVQEVAQVLSDVRQPVVVDPVLVAKGGARLLEPAAEEVLRRRLLPLAWVVTPNLPEAEALLGVPIVSAAERREACRHLCDFGARAVLLKGGHGEEPMVEDLLYDGERFIPFVHPRLQTRHTHGTGCTLSAALATGLAQGLQLPAAAAQAIAFVQAAMKAAPGFGAGHGPLGHHGGQVAWTSDCMP